MGDVTEHFNERRRAQETEAAKLALEKADAVRRLQNRNTKAEVQRINAANQQPGFLSGFAQQVGRAAGGARAPRRHYRRTVYRRAPARRRSAPRAVYYYGAPAPAPKPRYRRPAYRRAPPRRHRARKSGRSGGGYNFWGGTGKGGLF
jgi:hypothetical protein